MDYSRAIVKIKGTPIPGLTNREFRILEELMNADGKILSRRDLLMKVWGYDKSQTDDISTRTVDVHIVRLRSKIKTALRSKSYTVIATVPLRGYKLNF
jgi:DNA-binding response OmpR family regulator